MKMKKTRRITLIVLALALALLATLVTVAFAENERAEQSAVGSYTAPDGAWQPTDPAIAYAIFASEEDYLKANDPITTSTNALIDLNVVRANKVAYFVLFADVSYKNGDPMLTKGQDVTFNLGGKKLTSSTNIKLSTVSDAAKLAFKNGFIVNSYQLQLHRGSEFRMENVNYTGSQFGYNSGSSVIHVKDCTLTLSNSMPIYLGPNANTPDTAELLFENTDIILTSSSIATNATTTNDLKNNGIITFFFNESLKLNWRVIFDSESSLTCPNMKETPNWLSVRASKDVPAGSVPTVIFEKGFTFDAVSTPNFTYTARPNGETVYYDGNSQDAIKAEFIVADPGMREKCGEWAIASDDNGLFTFVTPIWTWAMYESETAYVQGADPIAASEEATLSYAQLNAYSDYYLRMFSSVTLGVGADEAWLKGAGSVTIDLNSNELTLDSAIFAASGAGKSVTVKNGTLNLTKNAEVTSLNTVTLDKVTVNAVALSVSDGSSLNLSHSKLNLSSANPVVISGNAALSFAATEVILTSPELNAGEDHNAIFSVNAASGDKITVRLDKQSVVTAPAAQSACWLALNSTEALTAETVKITMESGFTFGSNIVPDFKFLSVGSTSELVDMSNTAAANMIVVLPGTDNALSNFELITVSDGMCIFDTLAWELFTSEEAFLAGEKSIFGSSSLAISNADIQGFKGTYLRIYKTVNYYTSSGENMLVAGQKLVIDLCGNTLTTSNKVRVCVANTKADLTVKNGTFVNENQLQIDRKASFVLDNIVYTGRQFGYNSGGSYIHVKDSTLTLSGSMPFYFGPHDKGIESAKALFENTDIILTSNGIATSAATTNNTSLSNNAIFTIYYNEDYACNWRITIDANSSLSCPNMKGAPVFLSVLSSKVIPEGQVPTVLIEDGAAFSLAGMPAMTYTSKNPNTSGYVDAGAEDSTLCAVKRVEPGTETEVQGTLFANPTDVDGIYSITTKKDYSGNTAWYCYDGSAIIKGAKIQLVEGVEGPVLSLSAMRAFPAGSRIEFMCDLTVYVGTEKYLNNFANDLTLDLGGNTLYCDVRIDFGYHDGTSWRVSRFTIKNGKLISNVQDNLIFGLPTETGSVTISDMEIIHTAKTHSTVHTYNGSVYIYNSTFNTTTSVFTPEATGAYPEFVMDNVTVTSGSTAVVLGVNGLTSGYKYVITNCNFVSVPVAIRIYNANGSTAANTLSITVSGCRINSSAEPISVESAIPGTVTVALSDVWLSRAVSLASHHVLELAKGQIMMSLSNSEYAYRVAAIELPMRANLKLYSDLKLYFYIPTDTTVTSFTVAGVTYKISELTEKVELYGKGEHYVICIAELTPDTAAEVVWYDLEFVEDGAIHTATAGYSVIDYISALLNTDYSYSVKRLACATAEYIAAAYAYAGTDNAELAALRKQAVYIANIPAVKEATSEGLTLGAASAAISTVQLDLGATMKLRLNLNPSYTGSLKVMDTEYIVTAGKVGELTYVDLTLTAYEMYSERITVTVGQEGGSFTLADYAASISENTALPLTDRALVAAFFNYCAYADEYEQLANSN